MKFLDFLGKVLGGLWKFATNIITITLVSAIVIFGITIFMPENVETALEIFKKLLQIPWQTQNKGV